MLEKLYGVRQRGWILPCARSRSSLLQRTKWESAGQARPLSRKSTELSGPIGRKPTKTNPIAIIPRFDARSNQIVLRKKEHIEKNSFGKLIGVYRKHTPPLRFDRATKRPVLDLWRLNIQIIQQMRADLAEEHFVLKNFPFLEESTPERRAAGSVSLGLERSTLVIIHSRRAFLIVCPNEIPEHRQTVRDCLRKLSGVTEEISEGQFRYLPFVKGDVGTTFATYDVWLIAELIEKVKENCAHISIITCEVTNDRLESRLSDHETQRRPIPAVVSVMTEGSHLYPHQNEGVRFFQLNGGNGILSFEMGLGKTATALAYIAGEGKRAVVICPKAVRSTWVSEATTLFSPYFKDNVLELGTNPPLRQNSPIVLKTDA